MGKYDVENMKREVRAADGDKCQELIYKIQKNAGFATIASNPVTDALLSIKEEVTKRLKELGIDTTTSDNLNKALEEV